MEELLQNNRSKDLMVQRMADNDKIVTRFMDDRDFNAAVSAVLAKTIYESISPMGKSPE